MNATYSTSLTKTAPFGARDLFELMKERAEEDKFINKLDAQKIGAIKEKARAEVMAILSGKFATLLNISD
jgi:isocitrate lyase